MNLFKRPETGPGLWCINSMFALLVGLGIAEASDAEGRSADALAR